MSKQKYAKVQLNTRRSDTNSSRHAPDASAENLDPNVAASHTRRILRWRPSRGLSYKDFGSAKCACKKGIDSMNPCALLVAWVGIDWAEQEHAVCLQAGEGTAIELSRLPQKAEALAEWALGLKQRWEGGLIGVCLEQSRGPLIYALSQYPWLVLYPINPLSLARYRESLYPSRSKNDPTDAKLLCEFLRKHQDHLRAWRAEDAQTRKLRLLLENRETLVDDRTRLSLRLRGVLQVYFPQALEWAGPFTKPLCWAFLLKWPNLKQLQKVRKKEWLNFFYAHQVRRGDQIGDAYEQMRTAAPLITDEALVDTSEMMARSLCRQLQNLQEAIDQHDQHIQTLYDSHPNKLIFGNTPGAGKVLGPSLAVAFGRDPQRYTDAQQIQQMSGIAPVVEQSGKGSWTHWRWAAPPFLRQTFHEFAAHSIVKSRWAKAYYQLQIRRGKSRQAAIRSLAFKWIRILFRCWQDQVPYNEDRYIQSLRQRGSPLIALLTPQSQETL